tara:strand:- start:4886 stop:5410 length:525 start_codon:yes stop_codon:yes gene_type:complete
MKIAIIGKICSGKTTTADILIGLNNDFQKLSFAGKVKSIAVELFDMEKKDRKLLQQIGTYMREIDPNVWANYVVKQSKKYDYVVIDDLRYKNEYDLLKKNGFKIIKLVISKELQLTRLKNTYTTNYEKHLENLNHESELFSETINNSDVDLVINVDYTKNINEVINNFYLSLLI